MQALLLNLLKAYWPQLAAFVGAVALGFMAAWQIQGLNIDAIDLKFSQYVAQVEKDTNEAKAAALEKERFWLAEKENALTNARLREKELEAALTASQSAGARLRDSVATLRTQLADAPGYACLDAVTSLGELLEACRGRYEGLGYKAQGHVIDIEKMMRVWPK